ncbi:MAG TPA: hypothetical protein VEA39_06315 [Methylophilaceae bacterium]|nr:hypothetical protein [Methylophilaceae bacterium]
MNLGLHSITVRFLNLLALLAAVAWLARIPSWEPLITSIALLATFIGQELWPLLKQSDKDKLLLDKFQSEFPSNGRSVLFLQGHDIGAPFNSDRLNEIDAFASTWDNAEHEFRNGKLEKQRRKLLNSARIFRADLSLNVFSGSRGYLTMDLKDYEDRPEKIATRNRLNDLATQVFKDHQELVRLGRKLT